MPSRSLFAESPEQVGLNPDKVDALLHRARREVRDGLLPSAQVAIARNGKIGAMETFGRAIQGGAEKDATNETLYLVYSCTKGIGAAAGWILLGEGKLDLAERVADIIPEFGTNGKEIVTVEQLFMHTAGFPNARYPQREWLDRAKRLERFSRWELEWPPGSRYAYHATSALWVISEIIDRRAGVDFRDFIHERISRPLGIPDLRAGLPRQFHHRVADVLFVGDPLTTEERKKFNIPEPPSEITDRVITGFNDGPVREAGALGAGGTATAGDLAIFYQGLMHNPPVGAFGGPIWNPETLREVLIPRSGDLIDPMIGIKCNRSLGMIIAGDDGLKVRRGFGKECSPQSFGHPGAGGQIAWADPVSGISFSYCTNGHDRNPIRMGERHRELSDLASDCVA